MRTGMHAYVRALLWDVQPATAQRACPRAKTAGYTAVTRSRRPAGDESFQN